MLTIQLVHLVELVCGLVSTYQGMGFINFMMYYPLTKFFSYFLREAGYDTALFGKLHVAGHIWEAKYRHQFDGFNTYEWAPDPNGYRGCETAYSRWLAIHHPAILDRWKRYGNKIGHVPVEAHFTTWAANRTIDYLQRMQRLASLFFVV